MTLEFCKDFDTQKEAKAWAGHFGKSHKLVVVKNRHRSGEFSTCKKWLVFEKVV